MLCASEVLAAPHCLCSANGDDAPPRPRTYRVDPRAARPREDRGPKPRERGD